MALILLIETATQLCSVALCDDKKVLCLHEIDEPNSHAEKLHPCISKVLNQCDIKPKDLQAVAIGAGPGSYTGLRIGTAAAKGLCYALGIPLITVDTLQIMAMNALMQHSFDASTVIVPLLDARRMEVYSSVYSHEGNPVNEVIPELLNDDFIQKYARLTKGNYKIVFVGNGVAKAKPLLEAIPSAIWLEDISCGVAGLFPLAVKKFYENDFASLAYFEPNYLKVMGKLINE